MNVAVITWSQHVDGVFQSAIGTLDGCNCVSPLLPLNVQNCQCEVAICRPTKCTEKVKASTFLSYIGMVNDRLNPPKAQFFLKGVMKRAKHSYS